MQSKTEMDVDEQKPKIPENIKQTSSNKGVENGKKQLLRRLAKFRDIVTKGCGDFRCTNPFCRSNEDNFAQTYSEKEASTVALTMVRSHAKECGLFEKRDVKYITYEDFLGIEDEMKTPEESKKYDEVLDLLTKTATFWHRFDATFTTSRKVSANYPNLDFKESDRIWKLISQRLPMRVEAEKVLKNSLSEFKTKVEQEGGLNAKSGDEELLLLRRLFILLQCPLVLSEDPSCHDLLGEYLSSISLMSSDQVRIFATWLAGYSDLDRMKHQILALQQYMTITIEIKESEIEDETLRLEHDMEFQDCKDADEKEAIYTRIMKHQTRMRDAYISGQVADICKMLEVYFEANEIVRNMTQTIDDEKGDAHTAQEKTSLVSELPSNVVLPPIPVLSGNTKKTEEAEAETEAEAEPKAESAMEVDPGLESDTADNAKMEMKMNVDGGKEEEEKSLAEHHISMIGISHKRVPLGVKVFYNDGLNEALCNRGDQRSHIHRRDLINFKENSGREARQSRNEAGWKKRFTFLDYPFLLEPGSKARYLQFDNHMIQTIIRRRSMRDALGLLMFAGVNRDAMIHDLDLTLRVRRNNLVQDTLPILQLQDRFDLKKRLRIIFDTEEGIDQGGLTKEFFQLILRELFDVRYGMFEFNNNTQRYWFNRSTLEAGSEYELIGMLMGIAIYNNTILDLRFPKVIFKKLLSKKVDFEDFRDFDPDMAKGFIQLLEYEGNVEEELCPVFSIRYDYFGTMKEDDLKENGREIAVTNSNRQEYVDLYIDYVLNTSIDKQFQAFKQGFKTVCESELFDMFDHEELELLVCGAQEFDFDGLEQSTKYEDGLQKDSRIVKDFWECVHSLCEDDKRKLLTFCTGSDRVPIRGLSDITLTISKNGNDDKKLPTSHTCFNHLLLPEYSSKQILKQRLLTAIQNSEGFGLL